MAGSVEIPKDANAPGYWICARVDPLNQVMESNEENNLSCYLMKITGSTSTGQIELKQTHSANLDEGSAGDNEGMTRMESIKRSG